MKQVSEKLENAHGQVSLHQPKPPLSAPVCKALMLRGKCCPESVSSLLCYLVDLSKTIDVQR